MEFPPYTFYGGFLDIFGVMFALDNVGVVGPWSNGLVPANAFGPATPTEAGVTYGLSVFTVADGGGYTDAPGQFAGVTAAVPEPNFMWLFGAGVLGLFGWRGSAELRRASRTV
jgi:hypothetical protein